MVEDPKKNKIDLLINIKQNKREKERKKEGKENDNTT